MTPWELISILPIPNLIMGPVVLHTKYLQMLLEENIELKSLATACRVQVEPSEYVPILDLILLFMGF